MLLKDKVAIITGAGSREGIGYAAAQLFIEHGARVALLDLHAAPLRTLAQALGPNAIDIATDIRQAGQCAAAIEQVLRLWGAPDILLNNAGVVQTQEVTAISAQDYDAVLDVNLRGTLQMSQACIPFLPSGGAIICIASIAAQRGGGLLGGAHYAASKGGVLGLVKAMARELGPAGIRVNAINPGLIATSMNHDAFDDDTRAGLTANIPLARFGQPADVAGACLFLGSALSGYITGAALDVNGGLHIH